jgi:hypothetical protein
MGEAMPLALETANFMKFLNKNPLIRARIKAPPGKALVYAGKWTSDTWREISALKKKGDSRLESKEILPDVLRRIQLPGPPSRSLLEYAEDVHKRVPKHPDQFVLWRALSGIYAANAEPPVSFLIGGDVGRDKVFVATELPVLLRNPMVIADPDMRDILEYCRTCVKLGRTEIVVPYLAE